jgi:hypothetical protein
VVLLERLSCPLLYTSRAMSSIENNEGRERSVPRHASRVELPFHGVAIFFRERIVDYPFYSMAIIEQMFHKEYVQHQLQCVQHPLN